MNSAGMINGVGHKVPDFETRVKLLSRFNNNSVLLSVLQFSLLTRTESFAAYII